MREVDHHAETVHLGNHLAAESGKAVVVQNRWIVQIAGRIGPVVGVGPGQRHVTDTERVVSPQQRQRVLDRVAAFDAHQHGEFAGSARGQNVGSEVQSASSEEWWRTCSRTPSIRLRVRCAKRPIQAEGSGQMAKNSAARLPRRAESRFRWPEPRVSVKFQASSTKRCGVSSVGVDDESGGVNVGSFGRGCLSHREISLACRLHSIWSLGRDWGISYRRHLR